MNRPRWTCWWWWRSLFWGRRQAEYERILHLGARIAILERQRDKMQARNKELEEILMRHITTPPTRPTRPFEWNTKG